MLQCMVYNQSCLEIHAKTDSKRYHCVAARSTVTAKTMPINIVVGWWEHVGYPQQNRTYIRHSR